jgi:putative membrane protein
MLLEIVIAILAGIVAGTISGLLPGIHINLVATVLFINSSLFLGLTSPLILASFIIAMSITHTFIDFIPSIFLGAPNEDTALSILPGHRMLLKGKGFEAVKLTTIGCFFGLLVSLILALFFIETAPLFYPYLEEYMVFILIGISLLLLATEKRKIPALFIFILAGFLGYATLNFTMLGQSLFPLFTGLFGTSLLFMSFFQNVKIPKQKIEKTRTSKKELLIALLLSIFSSSLVSFFPGVGSAQAATISSIFKKISEKTFLILLGAINIIVLVLSFVALYAIRKPRTGVAVFVGKFLPNISLENLWFLLLIAVLAGIISLFLTIFLAKRFTRIVSKVKYKWLCLFISIFLIILTPIISGWFGLLILLVSTSLGILCSLLNVKKIFLMGCLLLPVIIFYIL